jgi:hypothetical protein
MLDRVHRRWPVHREHDLKPNHYPIVPRDDGSVALADGLIRTTIKGERELVMKKLGLGLSVAWRSDPPPGRFPGSGSDIAKPADHTATGGVASTSKKLNVVPAFQLICINCDALGIVFDYAEGAPSSTPIKCRDCDALRGTLGDLRNLALRDRRDCLDPDWQY